MEKIFKAESYFAWVDTPHLAMEDCIVTRSTVEGRNADLLRFEEDCTDEDRKKYAPL